MRIISFYAYICNYSLKYEKRLNITVDVRSLSKRKRYAVKIILLCRRWLNSILEPYTTNPNENAIEYLKGLPSPKSVKGFRKHISIRKEEIWLLSIRRCESSARFKLQRKDTKC